MTVFANAINSTIGASISGATNTLTITNPSNTASSQAVCLTSVGGTSSGDAYYQAVVSGTTTWSWGVDNSDSDAWILSQGASLGTNNVMRADTSGVINYPLQTSFLGILTSGGANITGDGTVYTLPALSEIFDQNSDFDPTAASITAPVTGRYFLCTAVGWADIGAGHTIGYVDIGTSNRTYRGTGLSPAAVKSADNNYFNTHSVLAELDAADVSFISGGVYNSTKTIDLSAGTDFMTYFCGFLQA